MSTIESCSVSHRKDEEWGECMVFHGTPKTGELNNDSELCKAALPQELSSAKEFGIWEMNFHFRQWGRRRIKFCRQSYLRAHIQSLLLR